MKKLLALLLIVLLIFSTVSCDNNPGGEQGEQGDQGTNNNNQNNGDEGTGWYYSAPWNGEPYQIYGSHQALLSAWESIKEFTGNTKDNYYIFPDNMEGGYIAVYRLVATRKCCDEGYIVKTGTQLFLPGTSRDMCSHTPDNMFYYFHDVTIPANDFEESRTISDLLSIQILTTNYRKIEDRSRLSIRRSAYNVHAGQIGFELDIFPQPLCYELIYNATRIAYIKSCIELDQEVIDVIINNITGLYDFDSNSN